MSSALSTARPWNSKFVGCVPERTKTDKFDRGLTSHVDSRKATRCGREAPLQMATDMNSQEGQAEAKSQDG